MTPTEYRPANPALTAQRRARLAQLFARILARLAEQERAV